MKLRAADWLLVFVKAIVSALLFVLLGIGVILVTQEQWHTVNWLKELQWQYGHNQIVVIALSAVVIGLWLRLVYYYFEQAQLSVLIDDVAELRHHLLAVDVQGLPNRRVVRRLKPMIGNVNSLFEAAQTSMTEERAIERSKDEMITNVSHDLRTPLTSILGYLGLIKNDETGTLPRETMVKYTNTAFAKAEQMKSLVEDLFDYTQVAQVDFKLHWAPLDLSAMLNQLAVNFELEAKQRNLVISAVTNADSIEMVGDPDRLARVFMNLISNGLKYGEGATFIRLSAKVLADNWVEVRVQNDGERIPEESIGRLFDRFYRVEGSRNLKTGGTGLGLAIVQGIVDAHGGNIHVESDSELTSFIVRLPLMPVEEGELVE
ncbi:sensor histidine kinase [Weissella soli]|jgi:signal transduction histidine kinase|uniref:histidine kinase n=2 Tax=Weissella soli TaxID=155866 RepID=A0A288QKN9_9LACO|nr:HAMP domain-containing sensor histidine kinase [Weissella soli]AOT55676.1 Sensor histidine kinase YcbM [Weissella soli]MCT8394313.1 sensor histidine kinase [Weissella soli]NKY83803.1 HAMP domain-containing histidine kinase [Weissella soli]QEA35382.1 HAMP domain-containing histidine kinase [Weissella soli]RDL06650.1 phospho-acceptor domain-containing protein [Weissella soli]